MTPAAPLEGLQVAGWDVVPVLGPMLVLTLAAIIALVLDLFPTGGRKGHVALFCLFAIACAMALAALFYGVVEGRPQYAFADAIVLDGLALFFDLAILAATGLTILLSLSYLEVEGIHYGEYYALLLFSAVGGLVMASSADLLTIFLGLETLSIPLYVLAGFNRRSPWSTEAALKYFLLGSFSTGFFLYGIALVYGQTGTTSLRALASALGPAAAGEAPLLLVGTGLLLVGFGFKVATVPFHMWTPDVYEGSPTSVTAYMATAVKAAGFAAFLRVFFYALPALEPSWQTLLWWLAVLTMTVGNVAALVQTNVKRLLAYSSIAHAGYVLVGFVAGGEAGTAAALFYLVTYVFMNLGAFGLVALLARPEPAGGAGADELTSYAGLGVKRPLLAAGMVVFMLALGGIPPTAGFVGKFLLFKAAVDAGEVPLAVIGVLNSAVSLYYYLRVLVVMYFQQPERPFDEPVAPPAAAAVAAAAVLTLLMGVLPQPVLELARRSLAPLF
ncbi:MAG TPA: NADH-quinone oxidoreductase subunit N [Thermodesulfobacteriota bacterium]|nr:NADH-quinone oxidoreductase subunit N [Thermodesulfobacteriota bacterium]